MKLVMVSIYDEKACTYYPPFYAKTEQEGIRTFSIIVNDPASNLYLFPSDYTLYRVGSYDDNTAQIEPCNPVYMSRASEHIRSDQPPAASVLSLVGEQNV